MAFYQNHDKCLESLLYPGIIPQPDDFVSDLSVITTYFDYLQQITPSQHLYLPLSSEFLDQELFGDTITAILAHTSCSSDLRAITHETVKSNPQLLLTHPAITSHMYTVMIRLLEQLNQLFITHFNEYYSHTTSILAMTNISPNQQRQKDHLIVIFTASNIWFNLITNILTVLNYNITVNGYNKFLLFNIGEEDVIDDEYNSIKTMFVQNVMNNPSLSMKLLENTESKAERHLWKIHNSNKILETTTKNKKSTVSATIYLISLLLLFIEYYLLLFNIDCVSMLMIPLENKTKMSDENQLFCTFLSITTIQKQSSPTYLSHITTLLVPFFIYSSPVLLSSQSLRNTFIISTSSQHAENTDHIDENTFTLQKFSQIVKHSVNYTNNSSLDQLFNHIYHLELQDQEKYYRLCQKREFIDQLISNLLGRFMNIIYNTLFLMFQYTYIYQAYDIKQNGANAVDFATLSKHFDFITILPIIYLSSLHEQFFIAKIAKKVMLLINLYLTNNSLTNTPQIFDLNAFFAIVDSMYMNFNDITAQNTLENATIVKSLEFFNSIEKSTPLTTPVEIKHAVASSSLFIPIASARDIFQDYFEAFTAPPSNVYSLLLATQHYDHKHDQEYRHAQPNIYNCQYIYVDLIPTPFYNNILQYIRQYEKKSLYILLSTEQQQDGYSYYHSTPPQTKNQNYGQNISSPSTFIVFNQDDDGALFLYSPVPKGHKHADDSQFYNEDEQDGEEIDPGTVVLGTQADYNIINFNNYVQFKEFDMLLFYYYLYQHAVTPYNENNVAQISKLPSSPSSKTISIMRPNLFSDHKNASKNYFTLGYNDYTFLIDNILGKLENISFFSSQQYYNNDDDAEFDRSPGGKHPAMKYTVKENLDDPSNTTTLSLDVLLFLQCTTDLKFQLQNSGRNIDIDPLNAVLVQSLLSSDISYYSSLSQASNDLIFDLDESHTHPPASQQFMPLKAQSTKLFQLLVLVTIVLAWPEWGSYRKDDVLEVIFTMIEDLRKQKSHLITTFSASAQQEEQSVYTYTTLDETLFDHVFTILGQFVICIDDKH